MQEENFNLSQLFVVVDGQDDPTLAARARAMKQVYFARVLALDCLRVPIWDDFSSGGAPTNIVQAQVELSSQYPD